MLKEHLLHWHATNKEHDSTNETDHPRYCQGVVNDLEWEMDEEGNKWSWCNEEGENFNEVDVGEKSSNREEEWNQTLKRDNTLFKKLFAL